MAYLRARRSIKIAPGFKVNLNKRSVGLTVGGRGAHYSINTAGTRTRTLGAPGTGLSIIDRKYAKTAAKPRAATNRPAPTSTPASSGHGKTHAGMFASHHERAYAKALTRLRKGDVTAALALLDEAISSDTKHEAIAAHLISAIARYKAGDLEAAVTQLEPIVSTHGHVDDDPLFARYELPDGYASFDVPIQQLEAKGGAYGLGPVFLLVSAYDQLRRTKQAAGVMQKLVTDEPTVPQWALIVLCELYQALDDWDEIIHLVGQFHITNVDDGTLMLRNYQAIAMANSGLEDAALETFKDCLRSAKRDPGLLRMARYSRAQIYLNAGQKVQAKRDLSRLYSDDPGYRDVE